MNTAARNLTHRAVRTVNTPPTSGRLGLATTTRTPVALEIGGRYPRHGWLSADVAALTRHDRRARRPWPFKRATLDFVYADDVLQDLPLEAGRHFLAEAHRCLAVGGTIRLVTPDIRRHVELYLDGRRGLEDDVAQRYRSIGVLVEHPVDLVRIPIGEFGHHAGHVYDFDALAGELSRTGFSSVERVPVGASRHDRLAGLEFPHDAGETRMVVEAAR